MPDILRPAESKLAPRMRSNSLPVREPAMVNESAALRLKEIPRLTSASLAQPFERISWPVKP